MTNELKKATMLLEVCAKKYWAALREKQPHAGKLIEDDPRLCEESGYKAAFINYLSAGGSRTFINN